MNARSGDESLEFLADVERRARHALVRDAQRLRAECSPRGAAGELVRAHPVLVVGAAAAAGVGLVIAARAGLRSSGAGVRFLARLATSARGRERGLGRRVLVSLLR